MTPVHDQVVEESGTAVPKADEPNTEVASSIRKTLLEVDVSYNT